MVYKGMFSKDLCEGQGELKGDDGVIYNGKFSEGYMIKGEIKYLDGSRYEG